MKLFSRFIAAVVLTLSLTFVAVAGDIQTPGEIPPPPADSCTGDIQTPGVVAPDPVTTETLNLIQSLMKVL
jgi:hypothetical protein